jgi:glutathione synthase/RimK-type ligase-like ATP-grasp enzyme
MSRVALATCAELPELDEDGPALTAALADHDIEVSPAVWDDDGVDWTAFDLVVVRSTWDYPPRRAAFLAWAESLPRVLNNPATLRWNTDKHYLAELTEAAVPTIETAFVRPGEAFVSPNGEYVVKPAISAGSKDTARYGPAEDDRAADHVAALHAQGRDVMVQPYLEAVDEQGETALLYLGGEYSHAIRKGPVLRPGAGLEEGLFAEEDISAQEPTAAQRALGDRAMATVTDRVGHTLYGRVDVVGGPGGHPLVLEVELTEPSLYLGYTDGAAERFAGLIAREVAR